MPGVPYPQSVVELRYDDKVLRRVQNGAGTWVRSLCERSHPYCATFADTLQRWFSELGGNKRMLTDLTSADDVTFSAGRWELTAARMFHNHGFHIDFEPPVQSTIAGSNPKTPDFRATGQGLSPLVEVFNLNPGAAERAEGLRYQRLSGDLAARLHLPDVGMLSLQLLPNSTVEPYPDHEMLEEAAAGVQSWFDGGRTASLLLWNLRLPLSGYWMDTPDPVVVVVTPPARVLTPDRVHSRLYDKLGSYKNLAGEQLVVFIGSDYWTHSASTLVTAMFGESQIQVIKNTDGQIVAGQEVLSGEGLMTDHEVGGHPGSKRVAACIFARHGIFNQTTGSWDIYPQMVHNPWAEMPLPAGLFGEIPEYRMVDGGMSWTTETPGVLALG